MKKLYSVVFVALLALQSSVWIAASSSNVFAQEVTQEKLTNQDIVEMTKAGLPESVIVAKIEASPTAFDTSPTELQRLKQIGISDAVILAMVQPAKPDTKAIKETEITIPDGTEVQVELKNELSGQDVKIGDTVDFTVVEPVLVDGVTVIEKGASATAKITTAKKAGYWGKTGKLEWAMNDVQTVSGKRIPIRFTKAVAGGSKSGTVAVGAVATTVLLGPVGLLWGLKKGKKAVIPVGNKYSAFVNGDVTVEAKVSDVESEL